MPRRADTVGVDEIRVVFGGVDAETIRDWRTKGMPHRIVSNRPRFVVSQCVEWRRAEDARERREQASPKEAEERARKLSWEADLAELRYREKMGQLAPVADVERNVARLCAAIRNRVLAIRGRWAPRAIGLKNMAHATQLFDEMTDDILAALESGADEMDAPELEDAELSTDEDTAA